MTTRVLIVEDETTLRETLAYNLVKEGYDLESGGLAIALSSRRGYVRGREQIETDPSQPQRIVTVRGVGYCFEG